MSMMQQVMEIPPSFVLQVNICCKGCVKQINKLFEKIDPKHGTRTSIAPQLEQGKALVIVTGNIDKAILFKKFKSIDKIPKLKYTIHEDKGSSSASTEVQQPNPNKNNKDNKNTLLVIDKKEKKNKGKEIEEMEKKEEKNKGKEIEEIKNMGQEELWAPMGPMNSHLVGQMRGHPTGQMIYGHPMGDRFGHPQQRQHFSSIFDEDNPNGCSIV
ncbi:hypothetical protein C1H46_034862 [Malus baccata]|uniref:HMA domain-containing protein n=1 Tax=Malus baccata TaxID=106549 RepID=A0A540KZD4_MALBA|nr:hypothetical protein C1H46_034862 [Malus baccata]